MFTQVKEVTVKVDYGGQHARNCTLRLLKFNYCKQVKSTPLGKNKIVIKPKKGRKLFLAHNDAGIALLRVGRGEAFRLSGSEPNGWPIIISVSKVINA